MELYPAIDLYEGKVVRLTRGDFAKTVVYSEKPEDVAKSWQDQGARWIHVVDLEGAKTGTLQNLSALTKIRKAVECKLQWGGGLRTEEDIENVLNAGVQRAVLGTKALDAGFFSRVLDRFGHKIAVSLDARNGKVQTDGWLKESGQSLQEVLERLNLYPLETIIYTDISKDGMMEGPNIEGLIQVMEWTNARVILSGGISKLEDVEACVNLNRKMFEGIIIGKALYEKKFALKEAVEMASMPGRASP